MRITVGAPPDTDVRARRRIIGEPLESVHRSALWTRRDRLVCLSGVLELCAKTSAGGLDLVCVTIVDQRGIVVTRRALGRVRLCCGDESLDLGGDIGVVVGSREHGSTRRGRAVRCIVHGDRVRARGMLRQSSRPTARGYRGSANSFVLEAFGGLQTIDVASEPRPKKMAAPVARVMAAWASRGA